MAQTGDIRAIGKYLWLIGTIQFICQSWVQSHVGWINCYKLISMYALSLISHAGKRIWECPL